MSIFYLLFSLLFPLEPRKEKTDSSNGNNPLSPQEQHQQQLQHHQQQQQQQHYQQHMQIMMSSGGDSHLQSSMKPERPNSFGPKITKRINFYHENNCKCQLPYLDMIINLKCLPQIKIIKKLTMVRCITTV